MTRLVLTPGEAAAMLGLTVPDLVARIRQHRYPFVERKPGGQPGDRGRGRWGLTEEQVRAILRGMERLPPDPSPTPPEPNQRSARASAASPDGRSRLRRGPRRKTMRT